MSLDLALLGAQAGAVLFLVSAARTAGKWKHLLATLLVHRLLPYDVARPAARFGPHVQLLVGLGLLLSLVLPVPLPVALGFVVAGLGLYALMTVYLAVLLAVREGPECECFGSKEQVSLFSVLRTAFPALCCLVMALNLNALPDLRDALSVAFSLLLAAALMFVPRLTIRTRGSAPMDRSSV